MGCRNSRPREDVIVAVAVNKDQNVKKTEEAIPNNNEEVSEFSLRECSLIPVQTDNNKRRISDDPSIYAMIDEIE
jgi:hypothetical protein